MRKIPILEANNMDQQHNLDDIYFSAFDVKLVHPVTTKLILDYLQNIVKNNKQIIAIQAFKYDSLISEKQLLSAIWHAWNGFKNNITISNLLSVEFLLYVSGQRQISKALKYFGLGKEVQEFSFVAFQESNIEKEQLLTLFSEDTLIKEITLPKFTDTPEKRKELALVFELVAQDENALVNKNEGFTILENYILTSISNVVFEASKSKANN